MVWSIAVILLVLRALGLASSYTTGGLVHLLPAGIVVVFWLLHGFGVLGSLQNIRIR